VEKLALRSSVDPSPGATTTAFGRSRQHAGRGEVGATETKVSWDEETRHTDLPSDSEKAQAAVVEMKMEVTIFRICRVSSTRNNRSTGWKGLQSASLLVLARRLASFRHRRDRRDRRCRPAAPKTDTRFFREGIVYGSVHTGESTIVEGLSAAAVAAASQGQ
jgi:hypothetical protein